MERRVQNREDAAELAADVFRVAWTKHQLEVHAPKAWLYGIAHNLLLDFYRKTERYGAAVDRLKSEVVHESTGTAEGAWEHPLHAALSVLDELSQEVLRLHYWDQLETKEIGVILGISGVNVRVRLHRARKQLEALLTQKQHEKGSSSEKP